jgi:hypothetical protein
MSNPHLRASNNDIPSSKPLTETTSNNATAELADPRPNASESFHSLYRALDAEMTKPSPFHQAFTTAVIAVEKLEPSSPKEAVEIRYGLLDIVVRRACWDPVVTKADVESAIGLVQDVINGIERVDVKARALKKMSAIREQMFGKSDDEYGLRQAYEKLEDAARLAAEQSANALQ